MVSLSYTASDNVSLKHNADIEDAPVFIYMLWEVRIFGGFPVLYTWIMISIYSLAGFPYVELHKIFPWKLVIIYIA